MHVSSTGLNLIKTFEGGSLSSDILLQLEEDISRLVTAPINQNQFDALISFTSNVGVEALKESSLLSRLNNLEDPHDVAIDELHKWNKEGNKVFQGLSRRRSAELDLFCHPLPEYKWGWVSITSRCGTYLKKHPKPIKDLGSEDKAHVISSRLLRRCQVLERCNGHTLLSISAASCDGGLGEWWILDKHWKGLKTEIEINPYAVNGDLIYLRNFPYLYQKGGNERKHMSQVCSLAMCLKYLDVPTINSINEYLNIVIKHGKTASRPIHLLAMRELGFSAYFSLSEDSYSIKDEIKKGLPVVASVVSKGHMSDPIGGTHFVVITGYDNDSWLVQDPFGKLDLVNGGFKDIGKESGKNVRYPFETFNKRFFVGGGATGWCWKSFREKR